MRLDLERRYKIKACLELRLSQRATASAVGISTGGLSKELARNGGRDSYDPKQADIRARKLAKTSHVHEAFDPEIWDAVESLIRDDLSPEQAAGRLKLNGKTSPSVPTIYRHVGDDVRFRRHLRHGRKRYRKRGPLKDLRGVITGQVPISERPKVVEEKSRFGDLEIDLVNGAGHKGNVLTINDRMTGFCILEPLPTKDSGLLAETLVCALAPYRDLLHTVTSDNGKEFAAHLQIAKALDVGYYFAQPYHSWERGANENLNGLVRQYLLKGSSFEGLTREYVKWIERKLNERPRKRLGFRSPLEYICPEVKKIYLAT